MKRDFCACHCVFLDLEFRHFKFQLFNILIIYKQTVTCGHKLIIIDVRLDRLFRPFILCLGNFRAFFSGELVACILK